MIYIFEQFQEVYSTIYSKLEDIYYSFKNGIVNIVRWFPVIWKDRNYDESFIFRILEHKFSLMEKEFRDCSYVYTKKECEELKLAKLLCKRLGFNEFDHEENAFYFHDKKWGEIEFDLGKDSIFDIKRKNVNTKEDELQESKEYKKCLAYAEKQIKSDKELFCKLLITKSRKWWL